MIDKRPSRDEILMREASLWALRSTCSRAQVGVVIATIDYRPLVSGYNGAPATMPHCEHRCTCMYRQVQTQDEVLGHYPGCPANSPCVVSVHGEANAIAYAAKNGVKIHDAQLFTTVAPCYNCSQLIINAGISRVVYQANHRDMRGVELLELAALEVIKYGYEAH